MYCTILEKAVILMPQCPPGTTSYTVRAGDTVYQIALRYRTTVRAIADLNPGLDVDKISIGQVICVLPGFGIPQNSTLSPTGRASLELNNLLRLLWGQHVDWTKSLIISTMYGLPDVEVVTDRYLRSAKDFEAVLSPIYGDTVAARFAELLTNHERITAEYIIALKDNNNAAIADAEKRLYSNANKFAAFLADINPYWSANEWRIMLYDHIDLIKREADALIKGNFAESILTHDNADNRAMQMADFMTDGIVNGVRRRRNISI